MTADRLPIVYAKRVCNALNCKGQATVENALVWMVLAAVMVGFAVLLARLGDGLFVLHALRSASHSFSDNTMGALGDVFLY